MTKTLTLRLRADELRNGDEVEVSFRGGNHWATVLWAERTGRGRVAVTVSDLTERRLFDLDLAVHSRHNVRRVR